MPNSPDNIVSAIAASASTSVPLTTAIADVSDSQTIGTVNVFEARNLTPSFTATATITYTGTAGYTGSAAAGGTVSA